MKVKIFDASWSVDLYKLEDQINAFLSTLPDGAVKHVQTAMAASRTGDSDLSETDYIVTVWYDERLEKSSGRKKNAKRRAKKSRLGTKGNPVPLRIEKDKRGRFKSMQIG